MRKILLLSFTVITVITVSAQDFSNKGKDFWVGYGYHANMNSGGGGSQNMLLYFATDQITTVTVEIPGLGYTITYPNIPANTVYAIPAPMPKSGPFDSRLLTESISPEGKGIHITSDKAIVAYAHVYDGSVSGATILYPTNTLGKEYYSVNYENISNSNDANCWMYVVASDTGTTVVEITPSAQTLNHAPGVPFTVSLTQGQIYNIMATYDNFSKKGGDLTGSKIKSLASANGGCKKIAVFSGSGRINIGCGNTNGSSDNYMVQDLPKTAWGKNYLTVPSAGYNNVAAGAPYAYNLYRICVLDPLTVVKLDGIVLNPATLVSGFYYQVNQTNVPHRVESDLPIMVAQYLPSRSLCNNPGPAADGDPEVIYLSPIEQSISTVRWLACRNSAINPNKHYINVVIPNTGTAISSLILDGTPVAAGNFIPHPQFPGYSYAVLNVTGSNFPPGISHFLQSDSGFNAIAYGYGSAESYGYNAGTNVRDLYQQVGVSTTYGIETTPSVCTGAPFKFKVSLPYCADSIKWDLSMLPGPPAVPATQIYSTCAAVPGGPDSITTLNGKQIFWYSLPATYIFSNTGSFPVNIKVYNTANLDGCGNVQQIDFDLQVSDPQVPDFSWAPSGCVADPFQFNETTPQAPKPTYKWWWSFGDVGSGANNTSALRNPTHIFSTPGPHLVRYAAITTSGCLIDTVEYTVNVPDLPTAVMSGSNLTACVNTAPAPTIIFTGSLGTPEYIFDYTIDDGTGPGPVITSPPSSGGILTINHPTTVAGMFTYKLVSVRNVGSATCTRNIAGQTVIVNILPNHAIALAAGSGSVTQALCINTPIVSISYNLSGGATGATVTGLPAGVTYSVTGTTLNIIGTPNPVFAGGSAPYPYNVNTTGNSCVPATASGTITVNADHMLSLNAGSTPAQAVCINSPIAPIIYTIGGGATGVTITGLPAGVTYSVSGNTVTISGAPSTTAGSPFNYTINTTGNTCVVAPALSGTLTVNPNHAIALAAGSGPVTQAVCINTSIASISYNLSGGATGATVTGLPAGVTYSVTGTTLTIIGTPNPVFAGGSASYPYTVNTTGNTCVIATANGTITVNADHTLSLNVGSTPVQAACINSPIVPIIYTIGGGATGVNITGLPAGVTYIVVGNTVTISGTPSTTTGSPFGYTINTTGNACVTAPPLTGNISVNPLPTALVTGDIEVCQNGAMPGITFTGANATVPYTFTYSVNGGPAQTVSTTGTNSSVTVQQSTAVANTFTYTLLSVQDGSTTTCTQVQSGTVVVKVNPLPTAAISGAKLVCINAAAPDITFTGAGSTLPYIFSYRINAGPLQTISTSGSNTSVTLSVPTTAAGTFTYTLESVQDGSSTACNQTQTGNAVVVVSDTFPQPNFAIDKTAYCIPNAIVTFSNTSTVADGSSMIYVWNFGDGSANSMAINPPPHWYGTTGPFNVVLQAQSTATGCMHDTTIFINNIHPQPKANFTFNKPGICIGADVTITDNSDGKDGTINQWNWDLGDGATRNTNTFTYTFTDTLTYNVKLYSVNSFGCNSDTLVKPFIVYPYPHVDAGPDRFILEGGTITLEPVTYATNAQYLWTPNLYLIDNTTARVKVDNPLTDMTYTLTVTNGGGCAASDDVFVKLLKFPIIPNTFTPNNDGINDFWRIDYLNTYPNNRVQIFTRSGQLVFESRGYNTPWDGTLKGKALPIDTYYYIIEPGNGRDPITGYVTILK